MELKPCPFCGCEADFDEDSGDGVTCAKTEGSCGFYFNNDGGWTRKEVAALWNRRASPAPEQDDRERAEAFLDAELNDMRDSADSTPVGTVSIGRLAALLAEVRAEERERCAKAIGTAKRIRDDAKARAIAAIRGSR